MKRTTFTRLVSAFCLICAFVGVAAAQTVTGSIVGHVEDVNGAALPGARVLVTDVDRGTTREATTNDEGDFSINSVDPGAYRIEIEQTNFKKSVRERVEVAIDTTDNVSRHFDPAGLHSDHLHADWITNNGIQFKDWELSYVEVESFLVEVEDLADRISTVSSFEDD